MAELHGVHAGSDGDADHDGGSPIKVGEALRGVNVAAFDFHNIP